MILAYDDRVNDAYDKLTQGWRFSHACYTSRFLKLVNLQVNDNVEIDVENGRVIIKPRIRPSYTLDELLAQCSEEDFVFTTEDCVWDEAKPVGNELL